MTKNFAANLKIGAVMGSSVGRVFGGVNKKIKEQESTLKKLRAAYKDASKGTGEYANSLDKLGREITQTEAKLKRLRAASKIDLGKSLKGVGSTFGKDLARGGIVGGTITAAGLGIAKNMLDVTAAFEKSLTVLKTVEGSQAKAQASFSWIQDFAQRTPFELQQVTDAFVRLRAYGIDPIRGDALRVLGDTSSAMGKDIMDAVEAIADAVTGENERLKEFGIKAAKDGAKITYTWTDRAGKQQRKSVDANNKAMIQSTLLAIWNAKYKGAMDDQSRTWNGMMSNMKDTWARFAYDVMQSGPFEELKKQLQSLLDKVGVWAKDGTLKMWAERTGKWMVDTGGKVWKFGQTIFRALDATQNFLGGWENLGYALIALNFAPTIAAIGSMVASLWTLTGASWAAVGPWLALAAAIGSVIYIFNNLDTVGEKVNGFLDAIIGDGYTTMMGDALNNLVWFITEDLPHAFTELGNTITTFATNASNAIRDAFASVFAWLINQFDMIGNKIAAIWDKAKALGESVKSFFGFGSAASPTSAPVTPAESMPDRSTSMNQSNNFNINVNAPGADGRRIADQLRNEFNRKPLFDMDGALAPG